MICSAGMSESRDVTPVSKEEIDKLAATWLSALQPTLVGVQHKIVQLIDKQSSIVDDLEKQNNLLTRVTDDVCLQGLSEQLSTLDERLFKIMREMTVINARAKILTVSGFLIVLTKITHSIEKDDRSPQGQWYKLSSRWGSHNTHGTVEPRMEKCWQECPGNISRGGTEGCPSNRDAMELQQVRRREALLRESKKERELQREQGLIAKPTSPTTSLSTKDN
uniref:Uncharacterized protein n=1 Tax=Timema shepardi TaxID=629360 RepID=A0A7R9BAU8_TIMSH|nr:unnamed protein product [Timema shepardi]